MRELVRQEGEVAGATTGQEDVAPERHRTVAREEEDERAECVAGPPVEHDSALGKSLAGGTERRALLIRQVRGHPR
jgi:hypothetical protein